MWSYYIYSIPLLIIWGWIFPKALNIITTKISIMSETTIVKVDDKMRIRLTNALCEAEGIEPGSLVRITVEKVSKPAKAAKNEKSQNINPLMAQAPTLELVLA